MAYTLGDPFRSLRLLLRINGLLGGVVLGLCLLVTPESWLLSWGVYESGALWPFRFAGASQLGLGLFFFLMANQDDLSRLMLLSTVIANSVLALVLLTAYLQQELTSLSTVGQVVFVLVFLLYLMGAVIPLRYVHSG